MQQLTDDTFFARLLVWLARKVLRFRSWFLYPQLLLFVICVLYTVKYLEFDTSRNNLVGSNKKYHQNFLRFKKEFPTQDDLVVVVESENSEKNRQFVERLGTKMEAESNLEELKQRLKDYRPFIEQFTRTTNLASLFDMINTQFRTAKREKSAQTD